MTDKQTYESMLNRAGIMFSVFRDDDDPKHIVVDITPYSKNVFATGNCFSRLVFDENEKLVCALFGY